MVAQFCKCTNCHGIVHFQSTIRKAFELHLSTCHRKAKDGVGACALWPVSQSCPPPPRSAVRLWGSQSASPCLDFLICNGTHPMQMCGPPKSCSGFILDAPFLALLSLMLFAALKLSRTPGPSQHTHPPHVLCLHLVCGRTSAKEYTESEK